MGKLLGTPDKHPDMATVPADDEPRSVPLEVVHGAEEVVLWLWPNTDSPVTVKLAYRQWATIERKAREMTDGDVEELVGSLLEEDIMNHYL